jgi:hypothetical protein
MTHCFRVRPIAAAVLAVSMCLVGATSANAVVLTTNFSDFSGLAYGSGTTQTIAQNGIRLQALQGMYEVTFFPEINLKDFPANGAVRVIQLDLQSGSNFDFEGFSIRDVWNNLMTVTSDRGGSFVVPSGFQDFTFSGPDWEDLTWVRFTYTGQYTEAKITSFSLTPVEAVPSQGTTWSAIKQLLQ